jgi:hypothetical protein
MPMGMAMKGAVAPRDRPKAGATDSRLREIIPLPAYHRVPKLFADLTLARGDGRYARVMRSLNAAQLLILWS